MKDYFKWFKENILKSRAMTVFSIGFITLIILLCFGKLSGDHFMVGLPILTGIAMASNKIGDLLDKGK